MEKKKKNEKIYFYLKSINKYTLTDFIHNRTKTVYSQNIYTVRHFNHSGLFSLWKCFHINGEDKLIEI